MFNDSIGAINTQVILYLARYCLNNTSSLENRSYLDQGCLDYDGYKFPYIYYLNFGNSAIHSKWFVWSCFILMEQMLAKFRATLRYQWFSCCCANSYQQYTFNFNLSIIYLLMRVDLVVSVEALVQQISYLFNYWYCTSTNGLDAAVPIISIIVIGISTIAFKKLHAFDMEDV